MFIDKKLPKFNKKIRKKTKGSIDKKLETW